jgi:hypothetical protein
MDPFEAEFLAQFKTLESDSRACCTFVYTELVAHQLAGNDKELSDRLTPHAMFWNGVLGGLQSASFAALGRLYDTRTDTYNIRRLLGYVQKYRGIFSEAALANRKKASGLPAEDAVRFAQEAEGFKNDDLEKVIEESQKFQDYYENRVRPIRHQVFAHAGAFAPEDRDELFAQLDLQRYQALVLFPLRLHRALRELYHNGRRLTLESIPTTIDEVMANLPGQGPGTWEHLHVSERVLAVMKALLQMPNPIRKD